MIFMDFAKAFAVLVFLGLLVGAHQLGYPITMWYFIFAVVVSLPLGWVLLLGVASIGVWSEDRARARRRAKAAARKLSDGQ